MFCKKVYSYFIVCYLKTLLEDLKKGFLNHLVSLKYVILASRTLLFTFLSPLLEPYRSNWTKLLSVILRAFGKMLEIILGSSGNTVNLAMYEKVARLNFSITISHRIDNVLKTMLKFMFI